MSRDVDTRPASPVVLLRQRAAALEAWAQVTTVLYAVAFVVAIATGTVWAIGLYGALTGSTGCLWISLRSRRVR